MALHHRTRLVSIILLVGLLGLLMGCLTFGLLIRSRFPSFYLPIWLSRHQAIILHSGPVCRPNLTRAACLSGVMDQTFHVIAWQPEGSQVLMSISEE